MTICKTPPGMKWCDLFLVRMRRADGMEFEQYYAAKHASQVYDVVREHFPGVGVLSLHIVTHSHGVWFDPAALEDLERNEF